MKRISTLRSLRNAPPAAFSAGLTLAMAIAPGEGLAQDQLYPIDPTESSLTLPTITVTGEGTRTPNTLKRGTSIGRLPGTVQDTPQVVNVVSEELIEQQNVTTLNQALRNVPGVTQQIGEGNGGLNGDQFRIRGFEAKGDIYVDGLRDFGVYTRDAFNYEEVQVLKGPSSQAFGMGSTGGVINSQTKIPRLEEFAEASISGGNGPFGRATADVNHNFDDVAAVRLNAMYTSADAVDRDHVESERYGFAPSVGFGLGEPTTWTLNYFYQHDERVPDYGVPGVTRPGETVGRPVTEFDVNRSNFYGKDTDVDDSDVHIVTSRFKHEIADGFTLYNDTRLGVYDRLFSSTPPECGAACSAAFFAGGNPFVAFGAGGGTSFDQDSRGLQNVLSGLAEFETGPLRHELVAGIDYFFQDDHRQGLSYTSPKGPPSTIRDPNFGSTHSLVENPNNVKDAESTNVALFASDRVWLLPQLSVLGGLRWDTYDAEYRTRTAAGVTEFESETDFLSPKASLIWEPTENQTYYVSYAKAASPPGQFVTNAANPLGATDNNRDPEESESFEIGGKVGLLDGRVGVTAAVFQVEKSNSQYTDPVTGDQVTTGDEQRVRGFEASVTGAVTDAWTVQAAYAYLDSEVLDSVTLLSIGNEVRGVPEHAASLWTTYDISTLVPTGPGVLLVGGGIVYRDTVFTTEANNFLIPETFSLDALVSYEWDKFRVALNGFNLTDELNYDSYFSSRATPSAGRTVMLTLDAKF